MKCPRHGRRPTRTPGRDVISARGVNGHDLADVDVGPLGCCPVTGDEDPGQVPAEVPRGTS